MRKADAILAAMRSGEWLRTQWIARVAYNLPATRGPWTPYYDETYRMLENLRRRGTVARRQVNGRTEWRLTPAPVPPDGPPA